MCIYNIYKKFGLLLRVHTAWTLILELLLLKRTVKLWNWLEKSAVHFTVDHKYNTGIPLFC